MSRRWAARARSSVMTMLVAFVMGGTALLAQQQTEFKLLSEQPQESISASPLLLGAYAFVWAAVFVYVWLLWRRLGKVERELADVNAQLAKRGR
jgi:CcmD family protein